MSALLEASSKGSVQAAQTPFRFIDQAFGRPTEQAPPADIDDLDLASMTVEQRAVLRARVKAELEALQAGDLHATATTEG